MSQKLHNAVLQLRQLTSDLRLELYAIRAELTALREELDANYQRKRGPKPHETDGQRTSRPV